MGFFIVYRSIEFLTCVEFLHSDVRILKGSLDLAVISVVQFGDKCIRLAKSWLNFFLWAPKPVSCVLIRQLVNLCYEHLLKCKRESYIWVLYTLEKVRSTITGQSLVLICRNPAYLIAVSRVKLPSKSVTLSCLCSFCI